MNEWSIVRYDDAMKQQWDEFVGCARNATFLHFRDYMDYHRDRFADHSLMAFKGRRLLGVLPANVTDDGVLHSHQGLTYGGWLLPRRHADCPTIADMWDEWLRYCRSRGFAAIDYKPLPHIYATMPSQEDLYLLWRSGAVMSECNISAALRLADNPGLSETRRQRLRKVTKDAWIGQVSDEASFREFHALLCECLAERHNAAPVHTLDELLMLHSRFPEEISLHVVKLAGRIEAGTVIYATPRVVHTQYIATSAFGRESNLLIPLLVHLISAAGEGQFGKSVESVDFGTSNEAHGLVLNAGLYSQKASYGASGVAYQRLELKL